MRLRAPSIFANEIRPNDSRKPNHSELAVHHIPEFRATCKSGIAVGTQSYNGTCRITRRVDQITDWHESAHSFPQITFEWRTSCAGF
jgi:hypothetical protein